MREILLSKRFKKDQKKALRNPRQDTNKLLRVIEILIIEGCLPDKYKPHPLTGNWDSKWECHIQPDFLLIYEITDGYIKLERCGSHSELF